MKSPLTGRRDWFTPLPDLPAANRNKTAVYKKEIK
jgi:hypothetical protein